MPLDLQIALNTIAKESFRDQADYDYIAARECWRMKLREQFFWSAMQAQEKYLKAILLFNGRSSIRPAGAPRRITFGHDLGMLATEVRTIAVVPFTVPPWLDKFFEHLTQFGNNRYLTRHTYSRMDFQRRLDESVWVVRRYCQDARVKVEVSRGRIVDFTEGIVDEIERAEHRVRPSRYQPFPGLLEEVLRRPAKDAARRALVWNNMFYGSRVRHELTFAMWSSSTVPPILRDWAQDPVLRPRLMTYVKF